MFFVLTFSTIMGYLFDDTIGLIVSLLSFFYIMFFNNEPATLKCITGMIYSLPISYIGFMGKSMFQLFSWFYVFVFLLIFTSIMAFAQSTRNIKSNTYILIHICVACSFILIRNLFVNNVSESLIKVFQAFLMIILIYIVYLLINNNLIDTNKEIIESKINILGEVILATALACVLQYFMVSYKGMELGFFTRFRNRVTYDVLFKGYSVLSVFIGIGIVLYVYKFIRKTNLKNIICILICSLGAVLNSSRAGFMAACLVCGVIILKWLFKGRNIVKTLLSASVIVFLLLRMLKVFSIVRSGINILNDNGRFETYYNAWSIITKDISNILFGIGFANSSYNEIAPHNFILEWILTSGFIGMLLLLLLFLWFLRYSKNSEYFGLIIHVFISCMLITSFFSNTFTTVVFIIVMLDSHKTNIGYNNDVQRSSLEC